MDIPCYQVRAVVPSPQQGRPGPRPHRHGIASWPPAQVAAKPYVLLRKWIWPNDWRISHLLPARPDATRCGLVANVLSGVRLARHYAPRMVGRGWGRVIFVSTEASVQTPPDMVHYGMSKTAQLDVSRGMAQEVASTGVTVNCVLPGPTMSDGVLAMFDDLYLGLDPVEQERRYLAENRAAASLPKRSFAPQGGQHDHLRGR
ncbi:SDR family oxidoreductase (plasmid) [Streptomyces anulatus]|uniref:SDR family NAD(P)-dependent oxidoreductase n=1 Tax=Streptomyces anulatus TaxID=1892 RepID=UPI002F91526A|nr:SDR family oxidoreductase [Streptomyces anulatus]